MPSWAAHGPYAAVAGDDRGCSGTAVGMVHRRRTSAFDAYGRANARRGVVSRRGHSPCIASGPTPDPRSPQASVKQPLMPMSVQCGKAKALLPVLCHGLEVPNRPRDPRPHTPVHPANQNRDLDGDFSGLIAIHISSACPLARISSRPCADTSSRSGNPRHHPGSTWPRRRVRSGVRYAVARPGRGWR
jgi:hypothetical protein